MPTIMKSMRTGVIGSWMIKASAVGESFCIVMFNRENHQTYVSFFTSQKDAQLFIERVAFDQQ